MGTARIVEDAVAVEETVSVTVEIVLDMARTATVLQGCVESTRRKLRAWF